MDFTTQGKNYTAEELAVHLEHEANAGGQDDDYDWTVKWDGTMFHFTPHPRHITITFTDEQARARTLSIDFVEEDQ